MRGADHLKLIFPLCWALSQLAWAIVDGSPVLRNSAFQGSSNFNWAQKTLQFGLDFLMRCHLANETLVVQVCCNPC